jgi:arylsulfatase A-like enzyme
MISLPSRTFFIAVCFAHLGGVASVAAEVGRLFDFLKRQRFYENSPILLASDHGKSLGEHGEKTHCFSIYNATLHVALIMRIPGGPPRVVHQGVSRVDAMPTVHRVFGLEDKARREFARAKAP